MHMIARILIEQIIKRKEDEIARTEDARMMSVDDAREAEGTMVSRYDTALEEAQYLAGGQSKRLIEARKVVAMLKESLGRNLDTSICIIIGSIVVLENLSTSEHQEYLIVINGAGGESLIDSRNDTKICAVSPLSPIGRGLMGKEEGEILHLFGSENEWEIIEIL